MKNLNLTLIAMFLLILFSCSNEAKNSEPDESDCKKIIKRINSPDKIVDVVLVEVNGGTTVADSHRVYIVIHNREIAASDTPIFIADYISDIDIEWTTDNLASIKYNKARIFSFTNFWQSEKLDDWKYIVEVKLVNTSEDGKALK